MTIIHNQYIQRIPCYNQILELPTLFLEANLVVKAWALNFMQQYFTNHQAFKSGHKQPDCGPFLLLLERSNFGCKRDCGYCFLSAVLL